MKRMRMARAGGVQLTNVNNTPDLTRLSIVGVTIDNTDSSPSANGLKPGSGDSGAAGAFNLSTTNNGTT